MFKFYKNIQWCIKLTSCIFIKSKIEILTYSDAILLSFSITEKY